MDPVTPEIANSVVPKGTKLVILNPYFKISDGTPGIRVDDPNHIIFGSELTFPKSAAEFKEEAAKLYRAGNYKEAVVCF